MPLGPAGPIPAPHSSAAMFARPALRQMDIPAVAADAADTMQPVLAAGPNSDRCRPSTLHADAHRPPDGQHA
jgi:hypothetical protein